MQQKSLPAGPSPSASTTAKTSTQPSTTSAARTTSARASSRCSSPVCAMSNWSAAANASKTPRPPSGPRSTSSTSKLSAAEPLAYDEATSELRPHIHVSVGLKTHAATGYTSHLLGATVQFLTEMYVVEVADPTWTRPRKPDLHDVPLLSFEP